MTFAPSALPSPAPRSAVERLPRLCVSIIGDSAEQMQARATALLPVCPFQELRLDYLPEPFSAVAQMRDLFRQHSAATFMGTCRPRTSGGHFEGSAQQELEVLLAAAGAGCALVDLSLESAEQLGPSALAKLRERGVAVLVSFHDFQRTGDLHGVLARMRPLRPDLGKIVTTAERLSDALCVLDFLRTADHGPFPVVALAMGEPGIPTRVLGPRAGARFTFAAAAEAEATAPGQLTARTLTELYRIQRVSKATRVFGVAGDPVRSSLSPLMLNTAFARQQEDAVYLPLKTSSAEELFHLAREVPLAGFSVTMPLKQAVVPLLDRLDPLAARIGAVNTVQRAANGTFHGHNTDAAGVVSPLEERLSLRNARVLVLGAGGAARAAVFACADRGAQVFVQNRTMKAAQELAEEAGASAVPREALLREHFDVLIHATPAGMRGTQTSLPLEEDELRADLVFDLVYNPSETALLRLARQKGLATISGAEMFVHQGARQFELWTGQPAPIAEMYRVVAQALSPSPVE